MQPEMATFSPNSCEDEGPLFIATGDLDDG